ncbi:hypothetical protein G5B47_02255 [Paenibacillus sp. 7124]|uniref:HNH nuclease domain-containing protein n=1 Tax=Paenibacillus apii TaxID=1850370 RepID=A0A6M1PD93_9BACL|nr:hypothetical protein [Paenibacillus apii]NGM81230.1 hypothetical protein [Paenibacillus apii]
MSKHEEVVKFAYAKGYRVTEDGRYLNPNGKELLIKVRSTHVYPQGCVSMRGRRNSFHLHKLAAYCFYGEDSFRDGIVVRHMGGGVLDISRENLKLGTYSDNEQDKPAEVRSDVGRLANSARKDTRRKTMRRLTDEQVRNIKRRLDTGDRGVDIARDYGVVKDTIYYIARGINYREITA